MFNIDKWYFILLISVFVYSGAYYRRIRGEREMKIGYWPERILFPFSREGRAALFSIIVVCYLQITIIISYFVIATGKIPLVKINSVWISGLIFVIFSAAGMDIFYECPRLRGGRIARICIVSFGIIFLLVGLGFLVNTILTIRM